MELMPYLQLLAVLIVSVVAVLCSLSAIKSYNQSQIKIAENVQERKSQEAEKKAEIYADGKSRIAAIEAGVEKYGFELEAQENSSPAAGDIQSQIMSFIATPEGAEIAQKFLPQLLNKK